MLIGLDHVIIAVKELPVAAEQFGRALGLTITPGGEHPGAGTHNAIVRFRTEYIELISVRDRLEAAQTARGQTIVDFLDRGSGLLGFALAADQLDWDMSEARDRGLALEGPFQGSRRRPDGTVINWRTARVEGDPWGRTLPFLIQHETSLQQRRSWSPETHDLEASGIPVLSVAVADLEGAVGNYRKLLGTPPEMVEEVPALPARRARFSVGSFRLELLQPTASSGGLAEFVGLHGDGLFLVSLAVPNLDRAVHFLRERGTAVGDPTPRRRAPLLDPSQTLGARFQLVEKS